MNCASKIYLNNFQTLQHKPNRGRKLTFYYCHKNRGASKEKKKTCNPLFMVHTSLEHIGNLYKSVYKQVKSRLHRLLGFSINRND